MDALEQLTEAVKRCQAERMMIGYRVVEWSIPPHVEIVIGGVTVEDNRIVKIEKEQQHE